MGVTEKTLELNITHELLMLGDYLWPIISNAASIGRLYSPPPGKALRQPLPSNMPPFAFGLTLVDENKKGNDVEIYLPKNWPGDPAVMFIQYKKGELINYAKGTSIFSGSRFKPNPFYQFGINNNSNRNQHRKLRVLSKKFQTSGPVLYAFPRISSQIHLLNSIGKLLLQTTFVEVADLDRLSLANTPPVNLANKKIHHFRISQLPPYTRREAKSVSVDLTKIKDVTPNVIAEILTIRLLRTLTQWKTTLIQMKDEGTFQEVNWAFVFERYLFNIIRHWAIPPEFVSEEMITLNGEAESIVLRYKEANYRSQFLSSLSNLSENDKIPGDVTQAAIYQEDLIQRKHIVEKIIDELTPFRKFFSKVDWILQPFPEQLNNHTYTSSNGILKLKGETNQTELTNGKITFQLF
jgi:hypothetical protein